MWQNLNVNALRVISMITRVDPEKWFAVAAFCANNQPVITDIWVMLISVSLGAVQPWSHFRGLFISVVPHFSSLICIKGPRRPLTPHASVSEGMCLPDVASFEPPTAKVSKQLCEASVDGSTQSLLAEVFGKKTLCVTVGIFIYAQLYDMCVTAVFVIPCSGFKYQQNQLTRISRSRE